MPPTLMFQLAIAVALGLLVGWNAEEGISPDDHALTPDTWGERPDYPYIIGLLHAAVHDQRIKTRKGPPTPDEPLLLLFSVSRLSPEENGVYLFGPVPF